VRRASAPAKLNLALVVGPRRSDGRHEVCTLLQRIDLVDRIALEPSNALRVSGFGEDTLVRDALTALAARAGVEPRWEFRIQKRIPVAAGLGGGSSDAATALRLANETLDAALPEPDLRDLAASLGADVPFFLSHGPQLGEGDGTRLAPQDLPQDYWVVLIVPSGAHKTSTAAVYEAFDRRDDGSAFEGKRQTVLSVLADLRRAADLAGLPRNDLVSSPLAAELERLGAFRADVTGAGPAVYGLFARRDRAARAVAELRRRGRVWLTVPAWYG
jgi:4-diphosphocytidyl-2-C-methyl-D-erythritol kinase